MQRPPGLTGSRGCQCRGQDVLTDTLCVAAARWREHRHQGQHMHECYRANQRLGPEAGVKGGVNVA